MTRLVDRHRRHYWFGVLLLLFVAMRVLAILLFRPGGFFADNSDYEFYQLWGQMGPSGYTTFQNLWTAYPPLFPALMMPVFELSSRIPPWVEPRLFFHLLFGGLLLLFETGNLLLIYRLGNRLGAENVQIRETEFLKETQFLGSAGFLPGLLPAVLYALLFAPLYTLLGWFEAMPLFFMLLGLDFLLLARRWGWVGSAIAAALGFLIKLTPILLVPIAVRWLGAKFSWAAARQEWFKRRSPGNLLRPALYILVFGGVSLVVGVLALGPGFDPQLALSSFPHQRHPAALAEHLGAAGRLLWLWAGAYRYAQPAGAGGRRPVADASTLGTDRPGLCGDLSLALYPPLRLDAGTHPNCVCGSERDLAVSL